MPRLTYRHAVWISALIACGVYAPSLGNGWALDDYGLVVRNPAAHSVGSALDAWFAPYWPPENREASAGLWRPVATLSYALDWRMSGGRPFWFHLTNLLLHGLVTGLVVIVARRWLSPLGVLAAGAVFAFHPVHVEAVANVIGRTELLAALGLLGAVLAARRYRAAEAGHRPLWLVLALLAVGLGLGSKEHAVVAVVVLGLDHLLDRPADRQPMGNLYLAVAALTVAWLFLWRAIAGPLAGGSAFVALRDLPAGQRLTAAIPAQLEVLRLLVWPLDLSADYSPQVIPIRSQWSPHATMALIASSALLALGVALRRRAPAVSFATLAGAVAYLPTSNLLFTSGVMLAERALYLPVLAPALAAGWLMAWAEERKRLRMALTLGAIAVAGLAARTATRIPFWRDNRTVIVESFLERPESFMAHTRLGEGLLRTGDSTRALAQYLAALEIYDGYTLLSLNAGRLALALRRPAVALQLGRQARAGDPTHPGPAEFLADGFLALGQPDSAQSVARAAVEASPGNLRALENYRRVLDRTGVPAWRRQLATARLDFAMGRLVEGTARLDSAGAATPAWGVTRADCWEVEQSFPAMGALTPAVASAARRHADAQCRESVQ